MMPCHSIPRRSGGLLVAAFVLGCVAAIWCPACSAEAREIKQHKENRRADSREIEDMEAKWREAMIHGDIPSLEKLLSDDFLGISANGTLSNKEQYLHRLQARLNQFSNIDLMDMKVRLQPMTAIVTSQARVIGALDGKPINGIFRYTKVYGREANGRWQVVNFEATRVSGPRADDLEMHNGQPIRSFVRPPRRAVEPSDSFRTSFV